ncbi:MAG: tyrosine-type recombinase/integrase [Coriobacteriales bacterium]
MKRITEVRKHNYSTYVLTDEAGRETTHRVQVLYVDDDISKPVVYASDWSVNTEASMFLREAFEADVTNTKKQAPSAVKLLYNFLELFGIRIEDMTKMQAKALVEFMRGTLRSSTSCTIELQTTRSEKTVSDYLSVIRKLAEYLELGDSHPLLKKKPRSGRGRSSRGRAMSDPHVIAVKTVEELMAPMHVSTPQYKELLATEHVRSNLRDRVMIRLMREAGLRVGECLSISLEDASSYVDDDGVIRTCIELRNRLSDAPDQCAKTAMKVRSERDYRLPEYKVVLAGYEVVTLGFDLADELFEYMQAAHAGRQTDRYWERREATARADKVTDRLADGQENYYLFLNSLGRPLTQARWSQILREIYEEAGIPVDHGRKKKNLSHRLRHGYAMYLKYERGCDEFAVMTLLRHRSIESQEAYDNPTPEDILRLQQRIIDGRG